jgi:Immunity protein 10
MTEFTVRIVGESEDEEGNYTIAAADSPEPDGKGQSILFQRAVSFDEQDVKLGQDTYCIVTDPGQWAHYGGALSWGLRDRMLVIRVEVGGGYRLDLHELDDDSVKRLDAGLTRVLVDVPRDDNLVRNP